MKAAREKQYVLLPVGGNILDDTVSFKKPWRPAGNGALLNCWRQGIVNLEFYIQRKYPSRIKKKSEHSKWRNTKLVYAQQTYPVWMAKRITLNEKERMKGWSKSSNIRKEERTVEKSKNIVTFSRISFSSRVFSTIYDGEAENTIKCGQIKLMKCVVNISTF